MLDTVLDRSDRGVYSFLAFLLPSVRKIGDVESRQEVGLSEDDRGEKSEFELINKINNNSNGISSIWKDGMIFRLHFHLKVLLLRY